MMIQDSARKTHAELKSILGQHLMLLHCIAPIKTKLVVHGTLSDADAGSATGHRHALVNRRSFFLNIITSFWHSGHSISPSCPHPLFDVPQAVESSSGMPFVPTIFRIATVRGASQKRRVLQWRHQNHA